MLLRWWCCSDKNAEGEVPVGCLVVPLLPHVKPLLCPRVCQCGSGSLQGCAYAYSGTEQHGARMCMREQLLQLHKKYMLLSKYFIAKALFHCYICFQSLNDLTSCLMLV